MIPNPCIEIHTTAEERLSVPAWFAEVVIVASHLTQKGLLEAFAQQIHLVRGRFGDYEPIDFLAVLIGYALSGERTLADFFERVAPFGTAFMALFGRSALPHRSSLSRFLADVDRPCLEVFRTLFQKYALADGWTEETIGGVWDRQNRRFMVFDVDATRQTARQRSLPCGPDMPSVRRRLDAVCAPGYRGRKRGEVVRTRTTVLQMHTRQWIGTYGGRGNGDYRGELTLALQAITTYLKHFVFEPQIALVRLDGLYGDGAVVAQIALFDVCFVTRGKKYHLLNHPQIQAVLAQPPTASVTRSNTEEVVDLFDGGWLAFDEELLLVRVIVARHRAPPLEKSVKVGKRVGEWVYELFLTNVAADRFLVEDLLDLYYGRGAFEAVLADEDVEQDPDRWCSYTECGQELWQIVCQWMWNVRLLLGHQMQEKPVREMELAPPKEPPARQLPNEPTAQVYGPWQEFQREEASASSSFEWRSDGTLQCPAGATLWLTELYQENSFIQRAVYEASLADCQGCTLREQCLGPGAKEKHPRRLTALRRLLPAPITLVQDLALLGATRWRDIAGRSLRRTWTAHWRRQYVEVLPLVQPQQRGSPPPRSERSVRSHRRMTWQNRLARNAWWGPPQLQISVAGVPASLGK
jgi:hypothetical protein